MGKLSKSLGIVFNIISLIFVILSALPGLLATPDVGGNGISPAFAFWAYSVIFALIAMLLYTVGAIRAGRIGRLIFTIAVLILCVSIGGALDSIAIYTWN
ncbi:MAG: hypothetical protein IKU99_05235, partial [Clostridia bacterium]|nr:hypothetical protein [Clostridia bacterium]